MIDAVDKIYADAGQPATLLHTGGSVPYFTLQEAVLAWKRLPDQDREQATIRADDGKVYTAREIDRLHIAPTPYAAGNAAYLDNGESQGFPPFEQQATIRTEPPDKSDITLDTLDVSGALEAADRIRAASADLIGEGTILLVEDEEGLRALNARGLASRGYTVLQAGNGVEAIDVLEQADGKVDLVVSDVVMPEMDGPTLLRELRRRNPDMKIILISGYPEDAFQKHLPTDGSQFDFLAKPFTLKQLVEKVVEVLAAAHDVLRAKRRATVSFRDHAEGAEKLTEALSREIKREIERLTNAGHNEPAWQDEIDFLRSVSATLDQIATAISEARQAATPYAQERKFAEAETLASKLAKAGRDYAERNYERVIDYGCNSALVILGTQLFVSCFGVPAAEALAAQLLLLGGFPSKKQ